jgi:hypothetical protein
LAADQGGSKLIRKNLANRDKGDEKDKPKEHEPLAKVLSSPRVFIGDPAVSASYNLDSGLRPAGMTPCETYARASHDFVFKIPRIPFIPVKGFFSTFVPLRQ